MGVADSDGTDAEQDAYADGRPSEMRTSSAMTTVDANKCRGDYVRRYFARLVPRSKSLVSNRVYDINLCMLHISHEHVIFLCIFMCKDCLVAYDWCNSPVRSYLCVGVIMYRGIGECE